MGAIVRITALYVIRLLTLPVWVFIFRNIAVLQKFCFVPWYRFGGPDERRHGGSKYRRFGLRYNAGAHGVQGSFGRGDLRMRDAGQSGAGLAFQDVMGCTDRHQPHCTSGQTAQADDDQGQLRRNAECLHVGCVSQSSCHTRPRGWRKQVACTALEHED